MDVDLHTGEQHSDISEKRPSSIILLSLMPLTDVSEAAPILNECDLKLSNCLPAEINTLRKTAETLSTFRLY
jgi:hypothetical protein